MVLNLNNIQNKEQLHQYLKDQLHFPDYYGKNLDALNDCLGELAQDIVINFEGKEQFCEVFGEYGKTVLRIFKLHGF